MFVHNNMINHHDTRIYFKIMLKIESNRLLKLILIKSRTLLLQMICSCTTLHPTPLHWHNVHLSSIVFLWGEGNTTTPGGVAFSPEVCHYTYKIGYRSFRHSAISPLTISPLPTANSPLLATDSPLPLPNRHDRSRRSANSPRPSGQFHVIYLPGYIWRKSFGIYP